MAVKNTDKLKKAHREQSKRERELKEARERQLIDIWQTITMTSKKEETKKEAIKQQPYKRTKHLRRLVKWYRNNKEKLPTQPFNLNRYEWIDNPKNFFKIINKHLKLKSGKFLDISLENKLTHLKKRGA